MKNHYINATLSIIQSGSDPQSVLDGLQKSMQSKGHERLYASVLRGVVRVLETKKDSTHATVVVATEADVTKYASVITDTLTSLDAGSDFSTKIDETIVGGVIVKSNNVVVDRSFKTALTNLYRATLK
ncbi:MAG: F0F1-type ATP synthase delta subunit [Patiriisocius sp.]|jgi:F0F1-type ATP synthase delta subunit